MSDVGDELGSELLRSYRDSLKYLMGIMGRAGRKAEGEAASKLRSAIGKRVEAAREALAAEGEGPADEVEGMRALYAACASEAQGICGFVAGAGLEAYPSLAGALAREDGTEIVSVEAAGSVAADADGLYRIWVAEDAKEGFTGAAELQGEDFTALLALTDKEEAHARAAWMAAMEAPGEAKALPARAGDATRDITMTTVMWDPQGALFTDALASEHIPFRARAGEGDVTVTVAAGDHARASDVARALCDQNIKGLTERRFAGLAEEAPESHPGSARIEYTLSVEDAALMKSHADVAGVAYESYAAPDGESVVVALSEAGAEALSAYGRGYIDALDAPEAGEAEVKAEEYAHLVESREKVLDAALLEAREIERAYGGKDKERALPAREQLARDLARAKELAEAHEGHESAPKRARGKGAI